MVPSLPSHLYLQVKLLKVIFLLIVTWDIQGFPAFRLMYISYVVRHMLIS